jgi:hypothetical protein
MALSDSPCRPIVRFADPAQPLTQHIHPDLMVPVIRLNSKLWLRCDYEGTKWREPLLQTFMLDGVWEGGLNTGPYPFRKFIAGNKHNFSDQKTSIIDLLEKLECHYRICAIHKAFYRHSPDIISLLENRRPYSRKCERHTIYKTK